MQKVSAFLISVCFGTAALAEVPKVAVDIAPVHSLVARVMQGVGEPELIISQNASPHSYALRPSQAAALEGAQLVFWTSETLTPWLVHPLETLAGQARIVEVMEVGGTQHYDLREGEEGHDHAHGHDHSEGEEDLDPHGWLDPENGARWLSVIADALAEVDPENADHYAANADNAGAELSALSGAIAAQMAPLAGKPYMALHDGFQYFDRRFGLEFAGAITLGDASAPSPAQIAHAREELREHEVRCVFTEPQQSARLVKIVIEGTAAKQGQLDAIGARLSPGPNLYVDLLQGLAESYASCLAD